MPRRWLPMVAVAVAVPSTADTVVAMAVVTEAASADAVPAATVATAVA